MARETPAEAEPLCSGALSTRRHWAFGLISGYTLDPSIGPYPPTFRGDGGQLYTVGEQALNLVLMVFGALIWAYLTAEIIDVIVNQNPDETNFKNRMDDLNRYIAFYNIEKTVMPQMMDYQGKDLPRAYMGQQLRAYMYECKDKHKAESRRAIEGTLSRSLREIVSDKINKVWLDGVPFFRPMIRKDGRTVHGTIRAPPAFMSKVATALMSDCFAPGEKPPPCRLYMIEKGTAEFRDEIRTSPFCWGALDVNDRHSNLGPTDLQIG